MRSNRALQTALAGVVMLAVVLGAACETKPEGLIMQDTAGSNPGDPVKTKVGATVPVKLFVRAKFEGLQHEVWKVEPASLGEIYYDQASATRREATFRAKEAGKGKLVVHGFFGPPPPHKVAEVDVEVTAE